LGQGIRLALSLIVPATIGLFVLAGPLIGMLFERGEFKPVSTEITALVLRLYLIGIPFAAVDLLLVFAFYARKDTVTPALIGLFSLLCYMGIALLLQDRYGFYSLMIADSMKFLIHTVLSVVFLRRRIGGLGGQRLILTAFKVTLAATLMGLITYLAMRVLSATREPQGLPDRAILVFVPASIGGVVYLVLAQMLQIREFGWFVQAIRGKLRR
jgi:putative peptidoglycan lipid II flippase